jgi:hypothetical protein
VFIHFFGGNKASMHRYQKFVGDLGFDSVSFDLAFQSLASSLRWPVTRQLKIGVIDVWVEQIQQILASLVGSKILYSFSFPSVAALGALSDCKANDIRSWICEGGPFVNLWRSYWNYAQIKQGIHNPIVRAAIATTAYTVFGGAQIPLRLQKNLQALPKRFPILSIRYWQDRLVSIASIDQAFVGSEDLNLQIFSLPEGDHLTGLVESSQEYKYKVRTFLYDTATAYF